MTYVYKFYKFRQLLLLFQIFIISISSASCTLNASINSLMSLTDTNVTKPTETPSSETHDLNFELQIVIGSVAGKPMNSPEILLYDGDIITLYPLKRIDGATQETNSATDWSFTTDTGATLVVANDKQSAQLTLNGVGSLTVIIALNGKTKTYSLPIASRPNLITASVKTTSNASFSYTDLDVDWDRQLAFTASRKSSTCSDVVSFANSTPTLVRSIGSGTLQVCLGVKLFDNNSKLMLSSSTSAKVAAWDISPTMTNPNSWYSMGEFSTGAASKRISKLTQISASNWEMVSTRRFGVYKASVNLSGAVNSYTARVRADKSCFRFLS